VALLSGSAPAAPRARPLEGQVAIVTGAARGIGRAIAERLALQGAAVCITDLDEEPARVAAAELEVAGALAIAVVGSVSEVEQCEAAAERFGDVHVLVNDVVLRGGFNCIRAVAPWFRDRERSAHRRIVNIASVAASMAASATPTMPLQRPA
jgi:3-oxoacyl-[acyl-carrier protein] reductase